MLAAMLASGASAMPSSGTTQSFPGRREFVGTPYAATRLRIVIELFDSIIVAMHLITP